MRIVARSGLVGQDELRIEVAGDRVARDLPQPDLRAAQVLQDRDLDPRVLRDLPDRPELGRVLLVRPVREVEPEDVDPRLDHLPQDRRVARRRPDRGHDLGPDFPQLLFAEWFHRIGFPGTSGLTRPALPGPRSSRRRRILEDPHRRNQARLRPEANTCTHPGRRRPGCRDGGNPRDISMARRGGELTVLSPGRAAICTNASGARPNSSLEWSVGNLREPDVRLSTGPGPETGKLAGGRRHPGGSAEIRLPIRPALHNVILRLDSEHDR